MEQPKICEGYVRKKYKVVTIKQCDQNAIDKYCKTHAYMSSFTDQDIQNIIDGKMNACRDCRVWHHRTTRLCAACKDKTTAKSREKRLTGKKKCAWIVSKDKTGCINNLDENDEEKYCPFHQYVNDYTQEQIDKARLCKGCERWVFIEGQKLTCDKCIEKKHKYNKEETKEKKEENKERKKKYAEKEKIEKEKKKCMWYLSSDEKCNRFKKIDSEYCKEHEYVEKYTDDMKNLENCRNCKRCKKLFYFDNDKTMCITCRDNVRKRDSKKAEDLKKCLDETNDEKESNKEQIDEKESKGKKSEEKQQSKIEQNDEKELKGKLTRKCIERGCDNLVDKSKEKRCERCFKKKIILLKN